MNWHEAQLSQLAIFTSGGTPRKSVPEFWEGEIPWISASSMGHIRLEESDRKVTKLGVENGTRIAPAGSTLILVRGMSLLEEIRIGYAARDVAFNQDVKALVARPAIDSSFLTYSLLAWRPQLLSMVHQAGHGTGVLSTDRLKSLKIPYPEMDEQRRIAGVLGAFDDLIDANTHLASRAQLLAVALLEASTERAPLSDVAAPVKPALFRPSGVVEHYSLPAFDAGGRPEIVDGGEIKSGKQRLVAPSVLVSRLNPQTPRVWMTYPTGDAAASTEFAILVGEDDVAAEEIWAACSSQTFASDMRSRVTGTTGSHQRVDKAAIPTIEVPDPRSLSTPQRQAVVSLAQQADASLAEVADLAQVRDELLPLLMSGRITVDEAWVAVS